TGFASTRTRARRCGNGSASILSPGCRGRRSPVRPWTTPAAAAEPGDPEIALPAGPGPGHHPTVEPVLLTTRLALRRFTAADAGRLLELDGDPAVMRYLEPRTKSLAEVEHEVLPRFLAYHARYRDFGFWAAEARAGGRFLGWFGLRPVRPG